MGGRKVDYNGRSDNIDRFEVDYLGDATPQLDKDEGNKHTFTLTHGEHIIEILASGDDDWLRGVQFITNKGRCSAIYGTLEGIPTIVRSKCGILAGLSVTSKVHPTWGYLATSVRGIWRHDLIPHAPKENDVFSEYFGARTHHGSGFNDRALVGNSSTMYISRVEFWAGVEIDSIQLTYTDTAGAQNNPGEIRTARHGGLGGTRSSLDLRDGEHITSVVGRYNEKFLTQLCFRTSLGRTSDMYGGGDGKLFSVTAPFDKSGKSLRLQYILGKRRVKSIFVDITEM
ncbi:unnamed protein product [Rhizoctonia solani]|uniref:Jacalin-type lectin domain-containing protein n=1 Tax=Rhizoctonia solani TaxID=456999 RepID=A0A8H3C5P5_9AGAM|nr:unnamed protein product [Rhizoctonia solani]